MNTWKQAAGVILGTSDISKMTQLDKDAVAFRVGILTVVSIFVILFVFAAFVTYPYHFGPAVERYQFVIGE
jgi:hypothetical protein